MSLMKSGQVFFVLEDQKSCQNRIINLLKSVFDRPEFLLAENLKQAMETDTQGCRLAFIDISLPDGKSFDFITHHIRQHPDIPIIITTLYDDDETIFHTMQLGVSGYLLKADSDPLLAHSLHSIMLGQIPMSPYIARRLMNANVQPEPKSKPQGNPDISLTERELQILKLISQGMLSKQVAHELGLSKHTIDSRIKGIYKKCGIRNRVEAHLFSLNNNII